MEYSDEATLKISFNDFTNPDRLKEAVDRIQPSRGQGVETAKGLELAANRVFGVGHGSRPGVAKVLVLLTFKICCHASGIPWCDSVCCWYWQKC